MRTFLSHLKDKGKSRRYKLDMQARLNLAAKTFKGPIADIKTDDIDKWLAGFENAVGRTKNNYRNAVRTLFLFAKAKGYLSREATTEAEFSSRFTPVKAKRGIYSPAQLEIFLTRITTRMLPVVLLGAFAGMRAAEISRLSWEDVRFGEDVIYPPAAITKTASDRLIPILPVLKAWLKPFQKPAGKVLVKVHDEFALATQFKAAVDAIKDESGTPLLKIIHNGFRHSFISYRVAVLKDVAQVALEAGNSTQIIHSNYREPVVEGVAEAWFSILPTEARLNEISASIAAGL